MRVDLYIKSAALQDWKKRDDNSTGTLINTAYIAFIAYKAKNTVT